METETAIAKYGKNVCIRAYELSEEGDGASAIAYEFDLTTRQADCAIDAGRFLAVANLSNAKEYQADQEKWLFCSNLLCTDCDKKINELEDAFDALLLKEA